MGLTNQLSDQLVNITPTTMVYGTLIARATGFLNQLIMFGGPTLYPMLICYISIEHGHLKLIFHPPKKHSYVSLWDGNFYPIEFRLKRCKLVIVWSKLDVPIQYIIRVREGTQDHGNETTSPIFFQTCPAIFSVAKTSISSNIGKFYGTKLPPRRKTPLPVPKLPYGGFLKWG